MNLKEWRDTGFSDDYYYLAHYYSRTPEAYLIGVKGSNVTIRYLGGLFPDHKGAILGSFATSEDAEAAALTLRLST